MVPSSLLGAMKLSVLFAFRCKRKVCAGVTLQYGGSSRQDRTQHTNEPVEVYLWLCQSQAAQKRRKFCL